MIPEFVSLYRGPLLRAWQLEAIKSWEKHNQGIIQAVPGAGKTILAVRMLTSRLEQEPDLKVLIVCPRLTLIQQWVDSILDYSTLSRKDIYEVSSNTESKAFLCAQEKIQHHRVFISTFHQIKQFFNECKWKDFSWFLIVDEMHNTTENYHFPNAPIKYKLGLSATPKKKGKNSDFNLGGIVHTYSFTQALQDKIILDPVIKIVFYSVSKQLFKKIDDENSTTDLVESAYDDFMPEEEIGEIQEKKIVEPKKDFLIKTGAEREEEQDFFTSKSTDFIGIMRILEEQFHIGKKNSVQTLVFVNRIKKADLLNEMLAQKFSENVSHSYHSKSEKYLKKNYFNELKQKFAEGNFNVLISVGTLGEGIDFPYASHGIIASPVYNPTAFVQKVGRLLRSYKDHKKAVIYYYVPSELIARLLTDPKIEPNYLKSVLKIADSNNDLFFVDRESLAEKKGSLSDLLIHGSAYERNEDIKRLKIPRDLDAIMRFFKRVHPENIKNWKKLYAEQLEEAKEKPKKDKKSLLESKKLNPYFKPASKKRIIDDSNPNDDLSPKEHDSASKEEKKPEIQIDFSPLRNELSNNFSFSLSFAKNLESNFSNVLLLQKKFSNKKTNDFESTKSFIKEALKQNIIIKIKFGHELENIEKDKSILSLSEQEMLKHAVSAEINDFCSKSNELQKQLSSLKSSIASLESTISKKPSKNNFLSKETVDLRINGMCRIAKAFFDLQSSFLDEFDLAEISKTKSTKESKFFLTIGKDIFLTKQLTRIYSYPEDFGLSRWREEKEIPVPIIILSPIEKFAKKLMFLMDEQEKEKGEYASLLKNWRGLKEQICKELKIPLQSDEAILKELEKQKLEKGISFEKIFFVTEAIKKGK